MSSEEQVTRSSKRLREQPASEDSTDPKRTRQQGDGETSTTTTPRWKAHQLAEEYIDFATMLVLRETTHLGPYSPTYPLETISTWGYLHSPLRRPTILERWSPYDICLFEAHMLQYGKEFHKFKIPYKSTAQVIEFYYVWKKTSHYQKWKQSYIPPYLESEVDDDESIEEKTSKDNGRSETIK